MNPDRFRTSEQRARVEEATPSQKMGQHFGHFQDFFRVDKSLPSTKAERDLGSWP
jgi:hypothetical protein